MSHIRQIQAALGEMPALVLTDPVSIRYVAGFLIEDGAALVSHSEAWLITDSRFVEAAEKTVQDMQILCTAAGRGVHTILGEIVARNQFPAVGAEEDRMSYGAWASMEKALGVLLQEAAGILTALRASKDPDEIEAIRAAQRIAEKALDKVLGILRPGLTEKEVAAELVYCMYKNGGEANSFDPIVVTGPNSSMPHGVPGDTIIQDGDFVTMDFGTMYHGYCSDMTRTVAVGHVTDEMRRVYDTVLRAQLAGIEAAAPGVPGRDVHEAAGKVISDAGYGEFFGHGFGHGVGLEIHEAPGASPYNEKPLPDGAVVTAEPGIYLPGRFGVRIEDMLWLHDGVAENLTHAPKDLIVL